MIADPMLPAKIAEDRQEDIIPCIACNLCLARLFRDAELNCAVRPSLGHESEPEYGFYGFAPAPEKKKIVIVGAGIAGMQAGAICAEKGHDVTIYEKEDRVGGQTATASAGPWGDNEFMRLVDYLKVRCEKAGAVIETGKTVDKEFLESLEADEIALATGAVPDRTQFAGCDGNNVVSCLDVMSGKVEPGKKVVIVGWKGVAISVALYLVDRGGFDVSIVGPTKKFGLDVNPSYIWRYMKKLKESGVKQYTLHKIKEITAEGVLAEDKDGNGVTLDCDTVILANMAPNKELTSKKTNVAVLGDALITRRGNSALLDGYRYGLKW
jgi:2,4-dienoyl-CoA reductase (NADPH2)